ncbi:N-acetylmuramic acid 6-phosphate etherase [Pseudalkalibacillus berkeleyi]|uniref:N-acetylmuramic acid 6-phosphate etherase n=1 Tax=Pseudalkalibacillus berkeleyi TaxID=1069813 RepID=A0ABS9H263_9BACL|nr:N-acetylmuramic acid 6-phosphate etherase [Pseudalkalibacillus berkeleyi]MCF6137740.1 N-acetylmuramic acid 6-phosphate etherase [Pseudalkalibacillus berkeleyi]
MELDLTSLTTEQRNMHTYSIDTLSTQDILQTINREDESVSLAVKKVLPQISSAVDLIYEAFKKNGRLFYIGAGTSGRLGVIDAAECPPTFSTKADLVQAIIAGGAEAMFEAIEGAEDDENQGRMDLLSRQILEKDIVVGITASGRTPYVIGAIEAAKEKGLKTISLSCNANSVVSKLVDQSIEVVVGPEILTGSTRMKAATAQKMVLNMLTTASMIKMGKVYENLMVDVNATNNKLVERAKGILMTITGVSYERATALLTQTGFEVKTAIVMEKAGVSFVIAKESIKKADGFVKKAIEIAKTNL